MMTLAQTCRSVMAWHESSRLDRGGLGFGEHQDEGVSEGFQEGAHLPEIVEGAEEALQLQEGQGGVGEATVDEPLEGQQLLSGDVPGEGGGVEPDTEYRTFGGVFERLVVVGARRAPTVSQTS